MSLFLNFLSGPGGQGLMLAASTTTSSFSATAAAASPTPPATASAISTSSAVITMTTTIVIPSFPSVTYIGLASDEIRIQVSLRQYFPFTDPYLDTDLSVNGQREYIGIIDVHTKGMQRGPTLLDLFRTGDFSATQTTGNLDLDPFRTHTQGRSDRHLYSAFVIDTILDLTGNGISYDVRIQLRATDLQDIDLDIVLTRQLLQLFFDTVHFTTTFTDDDTRLGSMDRHDQLIQRTFNNDLGNSTFIDTGIQVSPDLIVLDQLEGIIFFAAVPVGFPTSDDP